jgi:phage terminase large subunit-like protein
MKKSDPVPDILEELYRYSESVCAGDIVACKKYRWACLRFIRDADRIDDPDYPWYFDNEAASRYVDLWVQLFVHSSGLIAGREKVFTPYERFIYGNIYGWKQKKTGVRRFRRTYEQVARKNAKSQDKAIQALYELSAMGESKAEVYIAATKKEQTRHVWAEAAWLLEHTDPELAEKFVCKHDRDLKEVIIRHKASGSFFARLSKDDKKSGDGSNPHFFILDEYHLHPTTEYYDLAISGMKTRRQPLLSIITTAGTDINCPCHRIEYEYVSRLLNPDVPVENDRYFAVISEVDTNDTPEVIEIDGRKIEPGKPIDIIGSPESIQKSNPILYNVPDAVELIREEVAEAREKPEIWWKVLTKTFNIWVNELESGYMDMAKWSACATFTESLENRIYYGEKQYPFVGVDLSVTTDLTSVAFVFNVDNGSHYVTQHSFMPENRVTTLSMSDNVPYQLWIDRGYITAIPGSNIEYSYVLEYIEDQFERHNWKKGLVCFDKYLAAWLETELEKRGFLPIDIPQNYTHLSLPTKELRAKVFDGKIIHRDDPLLNWAMSNCVIRCGPSGNIMLDKSVKEKSRIDPVAALVNAMNRATATNNPVRKVGRVIFA